MQTFSCKNAKHCRVPTSQSENLLLFHFLYHCTLNILGLEFFGWTKKKKAPFGLSLLWAVNLPTDRLTLIAAQCVSIQTEFRELPNATQEMTSDSRTRCVVGSYTRTRPVVH